MTATSLVLALLAGLGLSASTGLNTFLPLLLLSGAARFHLAGVTLGERFDWLASDTALIVLIIATVVEIIGDKVPAVDHFLDAAGTFVRPVAGALASASVLTGVDPVLAAVLGIAVGAPASLGLHTLKAGARVTSTSATLGCLNPVLSLVEDVISLGLSLVALFAPGVVPLILLLVALILWRIVRRFRRPTASPAAPR
jgi:TRAP-type mannitol/chloroaromatic compound transport system permease large subunit